MQLKKKVTDAHCTDKASLVSTSPGFTLMSDSARRFNLNLTYYSETTLRPGGISGNRRGGIVVCSECQSRRPRQQ